MFSICCAISNLISCREYILKGKKGKIVSPSQLDSTWLRTPKNIEFKNFKLLYVGRFRVEKGIFSLLNLIKNKKNITLSAVGAEKDTSHNINQSNVKVFKQQNNKLKLIIFEDISHVIGDKKGIFISKRNYVNFFGTLNNIKKNYKKIQKEMKKNKLPTNKDFIEKFAKQINDY